MINYRRGVLYAFAAAGLIAVQEPFSALAARKLPSTDFMALTQVALLLSLPLLLVRPAARRDLIALLRTASSWPKLAALLAIGIAGLALYNYGLGTAHPIIVAAALNLSPFWAALVGRVVSRKDIPRPAWLFFLCFALAFFGAMAIAFSQIDAPWGRVVQEVLASALHSHWIYALPIPIFFALSGTLIYVWFGQYEEGAAIAANFLVSAAVLIPVAIWLAYSRGGWRVNEASAPAIALLLLGTLSASAAGRLFYQSALSATANDNGFVTMFFLAIPALSALVSWPLSALVPEIGFQPVPSFFVGLALVSAPLLVFARASLKPK